MFLIMFFFKQKVWFWSLTRPILNEDVLSDSDSEEPIEESWTNEVLQWNKGPLK